MTARDEAADTARGTGKPPEREKFMTSTEPIFRLPNIKDACDAPDGPMPGQYQPGDPR